MFIDSPRKVSLRIPTLVKIIFAESSGRFAVRNCHRNLSTENLQDSLSPLLQSFCVFRARDIVGKGIATMLCGYWQKYWFLLTCRNIKGQQTNTMTKTITMTNVKILFCGFWQKYFSIGILKDNGEDGYKDKYNYNDKHKCENTALWILAKILVVCPLAAVWQASFHPPAPPRSSYTW